jgi:hypothetical protein
VPEPVTIGLAIATLIGKKLLESAADGAGESSWEAVTKAASRVRGWFGSHDDAEGTAKFDVLEAAPDSASVQKALGQRIDAAVATDPELGADLEALLAEARRSGPVQVVKYLNQFNGPVTNVNQADTININ